MNFYAVASFRNAIAVSSIIDAWSLQLSGGSAGYPLWSDYFDFYPFTATTDGDLSGRSIALTDFNKPTRFSGQKAPHLASNTRLSFGTDTFVLSNCLEQWHRRFVQGRLERKTQVLFRSLEIACQASRVPAVGTRTPTIHEVGIGIALWVSAFEILSHPKTGQANLKTVLALISQVDWQHSQLKTTRFRSKSAKINFVQKLYCELYDARNDFLHGNSVGASRLFPLKMTKGPALPACAALVYRAALMGYLGAETSNSSTSDFDAQLSKHLKFHAVQSRYEDAVLKCNPRRS